MTTHACKSIPISNSQLKRRRLTSHVSRLIHGIHDIHRTHGTDDLTLGPADPCCYPVTARTATALIGICSTCSQNVTLSNFRKPSYSSILKQGQGCRSLPIPTDPHTSSPILTHSHKSQIPNPESPKGMRGDPRDGVEMMSRWRRDGVETLATPDYVSRRCQSTAIGHDYSTDRGGDAQEDVSRHAKYIKTIEIAALKS